jgi:hypothetical protein
MTNHFLGRLIHSSKEQVERNFSSDMERRRGVTIAYSALRECTDNFGLVPRRFSLWDRLTYLRIPKPLWLWLHPDDKLVFLFRNLHTLFAEGVVVWGHILRANDRLFEEGNENLPAEVIYSLANPLHVDPQRLRDVADVLVTQSQTKPTDPQLAPFVDHLADNVIRVFGLPVPSTVSPQLECRLSTIYVVRKFLPNRRISSGLLPIVVNSHKPHVAIPLPARYWPPYLIETWGN